MADHEYTIIINGQPKTVSDKKLAYDEVVSLAFDGSPPTGENVLITIAYRKGEDKKPKGTLAPGDTVNVKDSMVFDVTATDKS